MRNYFITLLFLFILIGCSSVEESSDNPELLYQQAEKNIQSDKYEIALEKLRILRNKFPYSKLSQLAQLRMADVYFLQEAYAESASSYELFRELYPKHEKTPYALFRTGEAYFNATPTTVPRDLTYGQKSVTALQLFISKYPTDENSDKAKELLSKMNNRLAEKEYNIATFYFKKDIYGAAERRYKKIISTFPQTEFANKSKEKLTIIESKSE